MPYQALTQLESISSGIAPMQSVELAEPQPLPINVLDKGQMRTSQIRDFESCEIAYKTSKPLFLRFRNKPGFHVHLRRRGTGRYSINNAGVINGASTEVQIYCSREPWYKNVFETGSRSPRNILFGLPVDSAAKLLGATAGAIFDFAEAETFHTRVPVQPSLARLIDELFDFESEGIGAIHQEARRLEILALSLSGLQGQCDAGKSAYRVRPDDVARLRAIEAYIEQNLALDLSIERLSSKAGMSASRFKSLFRDVNGMSVGSHIRTARMQAAAQMLRSGLPVGEVALRVGFRHPGHFARVFREVHGHAPSEHV